MDINSITNYLKSFLEFSKDMLCKNNNLRYNRYFQRSKTLNNLSTLGKVPFDAMLEEQGYYLFTMYTPYIAEKIKNILNYIVNNRKKDVDIPEIKELREYVFMEYAQKIFSRFMVSPFEVSKIGLNPYTDEIISIPESNLSSIENIKPIFLFEKIASYIMYELRKVRKSDNNIDTLDINISIIGHTENTKLPDGTKKQIELFDLLNAVICWYNRSVKQGDPKLNCIITNIINERDYLQEVENINFAKNGNRGSLVIKNKNFMEFQFTMESSLKDIINENDLVLVLDCPFLCYEGGLSCNEKRDSRRYGDYIQELKGNHAISELCEYYNYCNNDSIITHVKTFKDALISEIKEEISKLPKENNKDKVLYFYSSKELLYKLDTFGCHSFEICEGIEYQVTCVTNRTPYWFPRKNNNKSFTRIRIRLWDLFKNISSIYVFESICDKIRKSFGSYIKNPENCFEICRDIFIDMKVNDNNDRTIFCSLKFSDRLDILLKELEIPIDETEKIKRTLYDEFIFILKQLFKKEIFCFKNKNDEFSNIIKNGFETCIKNSYTDISGALFLFDYQNTRSGECSLCYSVVWEECNKDIVIKDSNYIEENFIDKIIYPYLFPAFLSYKGEPTIGLLGAMGRIHEDCRYQCVGQIQLLCEETNKTDTELYERVMDYSEKL